MKKRKFAVLAAVCVAAGALAVGLWAWRTGAAPENTLSLRYYYDNACAACNKEEEFYALLDREIGDLRDSYQIEATCVNTFTGDPQEMEEDCSRLGVPEEDQTLPILLIGDYGYINGEASIETELRISVCRALGIDDPSAVWYFYRPECPDCTEIAPLLEEAFSARPSLQVRRVDTTDPAPKERFKQLLREFGIPEEEWEVPFLVYQDQWLSGSSEIQAGLEELLSKGSETE